MSRGLACRSPPAHCWGEDDILLARGQAQLPLYIRLHRGLELAGELRELVSAEVAHGPEVQAAAAPAAAVEALHGLGLRRAIFRARRLRHEQIDDVLAAPVDHRADSARVDIVEPAA